MPELVQHLIPLAVGIAISPLPIAAVIAILLSPRARVNGFTFATVSMIVTAGFTVIAALTTTSAGAGGGNGDDIVVFLLSVVLAIAFLALAIASWASRPHEGKAAKPPAWLAAIDSMSAGKAAGLALLMGVTNGKNIPLELKAGAHIGAADLGLGIVLVTTVVFAFVASLGLIIPTVLAATGSRAINTGLRRLKTELISNNAIIMTVVFLLLFAMQLANVVHALLRS